MLAQLNVVVRSFTPEVIATDANCYIDFLRGQASVSKGPIGVVGYCFSGSIALRFAALHPDEVAAIASFHGGEICIDSPTSPHLVLPQSESTALFRTCR